MKLRENYGNFLDAIELLTVCDSHFSAGYDDVQHKKTTVYSVFDEEFRPLHLAVK